MRIKFLPLSYFIFFVFCIFSCKDELQELPKLKKDGIELSSSNSIRIIPQEELKMKPIGLQFSGELPESSDLKAVSFANNGRGNAKSSLLNFDWRSCTWSGDGKPAGLLAFKGPQKNGGGEIAFYYKLTDKDVTFYIDKKGKPTLFFDLSSIPFPKGVESLEGWSVAGIIVDNPNDVVVERETGKINFNQQNKLFSLQHSINNNGIDKMSIPFGFDFIPLKKTSSKQYTMGKQINVKPLGTLIHFKIYNDLFATITPKKMRVLTNAFTNSGSFSFFNTSGSKSKLPGACFYWTPISGQLQEENESSNNIYELSSPIDYDINKPVTISSQQSGDDYVMWVMPTPHGQVVKVSFDIGDNSFSSYWSNKTPKIGLLSSSNGKVVTLGNTYGGLPITSDLMIASVYQHCREFGSSAEGYLRDGNYCYGGAGTNDGMIELYNPTSHNLNMRDYFISRVVYYLRQSSSLENFYFNAKEECERQDGKGSYSFHPYGYYQNGDNWNNYGMSPYRNEPIVKYADLIDAGINVNALQLCCDVGAYEQSRSILGDRIYNLTTKNQDLPDSKSSTPVKDLTVWRTKKGNGSLSKTSDPGDWGTQTCPVYYSLKYSFGLLAGAQLQKFNATRDYEFPVEYKAMPTPFNEGWGAKNLTEYDLQMLQPGKTIILGAQNYVEIFKKTSLNEYPYKKLRGVEALHQNLLNGKCQGFVGVDDGGYCLYGLRYRSINHTGTPSSSKGDGNTAGTLQFGPANGFVLSKREVIYARDGRTPMRILYHVIDRFGPTNVNGTYDQEYNAWKKFCTEDLPNKTLETRKRWYYSRYKKVQRANDVWTPSEWYSAVKEKGVWTEQDYDLGNHDPNTSHKR